MFVMLCKFGCLTLKVLELSSQRHRSVLLVLVYRCCFGVGMRLMGASGCWTRPL